MDYMFQEVADIHLLLKANNKQIMLQKPNIFIRNVFIYNVNICADKIVL